MGIYWRHARAAQHLMGMARAAQQSQVGRRVAHNLSRGRAGSLAKVAGFGIASAGIVGGVAYRKKLIKAVRNPENQYQSGRRLRQAGEVAYAAGHFTQNRRLMRAGTAAAVAGGSLQGYRYTPNGNVRERLGGALRMGAQEGILPAASGSLRGKKHARAALAGSVVGKMVGSRIEQSGNRARAKAAAS